jgi:hypothetical protein
MFGGFGFYGGGLAILLSGHGNFTWLVVLTFYMLVLARLRERLEEFSADVKNVSLTFNTRT